MAQASTSAGAASGEAALRGRPVSSVHLRCAATVTALALAALAGWATDVRLLATLLPGRPALSPMTASLLIVAAAALVALPAQPRAASWLGLAEALAGVAIIVAHELAWLPGRPGWWSSQLTGLAFAVSGAATALLGRGRAVPGQLAAFALLLYAALLGIGHLIPEADLYRYLPGTGVAIPTVLSFIALSIGQLVPVEDRGYAHALSRRNTIGLFAKKLLIGGLAATLLLAVPAVLALRHGLFDAETAVLLVAWGAMALLSGTIWGLAVAVERAQAAAAAAEQGREAVRRMVVAAVTHDLRSPLQAAMLSAQVIAREPGEPRTAAAVQRLQRSHRRLDRLLHLLLDGLSMEAGRPPRLQPVDVRLRAVVDEVVEDNAAVLSERVVVAGDAAGWWDRDALFRVVENLLLNAVKYGDRGSPIVCEIQERPPDVRLAVTNRGPAIPREEWDAIFQPFARGSTQGQDSLGWGVGLAYARSVAQSHGGGLQVAASGADGTRFELWLPARSEAS